MVFEDVFDQTDKLALGVRRKAAVGKQLFEIQKQLLFGIRRKAFVAEECRDKSDQRLLFSCGQPGLSENRGDCCQHGAFCVIADVHVLDRIDEVFKGFLQGSIAVAQFIEVCDDFLEFGVDVLDFPSRVVQFVDQGFQRACQRCILFFDAFDLDFDCLDLVLIFKIGFVILDGFLCILPCFLSRFDCFRICDPFPLSLFGVPLADGALTPRVLQRFHRFCDSKLLLCKRSGFLLRVAFFLQRIDLSAERLDSFVPLGFRRFDLLVDKGNGFFALLLLD